MSNIEIRKAADYIAAHAQELMDEGRYDKPVDAIQHAWEAYDDRTRTSLEDESEADLQSVQPSGFVKPVFAPTAANERPVK